MLNRRQLLSNSLAVSAGLAVAPTSAAFLTGCARLHPGPQNGVPSDKAIDGRGSLKAHAAACGVLAGAAITASVLHSDPVYRRVVAEQYDIVVSENSMKWNIIHAKPDHFTFEEADELVAFAEQHKMKVRGHNFVWHEAIPAWFIKAATPSNAKQYLVDHITTIAGRYRGRIHSWDVVNEAILPSDGRPDALRKSLWLNLLGPEYIEIAFRTAKAADPHALLTYNDYGVEYDTADDEARRVGILKLLRSMQAKGVPLHAVGIQSHIKAGSPASIGKGLREYMASIREMGLQIFITELDVNEDDLPYDDVAKRDHAIAETYRSYMDLVLADPAVKAVLTWGVTDRHTWLNNSSSHKRKQPNRPQRSLPFDDNYLPTESFFALRDSFDNRRKQRAGS